MQNKRDSYNRDDLLASSQGELFGPGYLASCTKHANDGPSY